MNENGSLEYSFVPLLNQLISFKGPDLSCQWPCLLSVCLFSGVPLSKGTAGKHTFHCCWYNTAWSSAKREWSMLRTGCSGKKIVSVFFLFSQMENYVSMTSFIISFLCNSLKFYYQYSWNEHQFDPLTIRLLNEHFENKTFELNSTYRYACPSLTMDINIFFFFSLSGRKERSIHVS